VEWSEVEWSGGRLKGVWISYIYPPFHVCLVAFSVDVVSYRGVEFLILSSFFHFFCSLFNTFYKRIYIYIYDVEKDNKSSLSCFGIIFRLIWYLLFLSFCFFASFNVKVLERFVCSFFYMTYNF
jgi:hypothetical protein